MTNKKTETITNHQEFIDNRETGEKMLEDCFEAGDNTMKTIEGIKEKYPDLVKVIEKNANHKMSPELEGLQTFEQCTRQIPKGM